MEFPHRAVSKNWYHAQPLVIKLDMIFCNFTAIEMDAFSGSAFRELYSIDLVTSTLFTIAPRIFAENARTIRFRIRYNKDDDEPVAIPSGSLSLSFRHHLQQLILIGRGIVIDFDEVFGYHKMLALTHVQLEYISHATVLAYSNFTGLRTVHSMLIRHCGVQIIRSGAFDYVGVTLVRLDLTGNELVTLPTGIFNVLLEVCNYWRPFTSISLAGNSWTCDCDLMEIIESVKISNRNAIMVDCQTNLAVISECSHIIVMRPHKICLAQSRDFLLHAKFSVHIRDGQILDVKTLVPRKFRLFIVDDPQRMSFQSKNRKCPTPNWIELSVRCFSFDRNQNESIPLTQSIFMYRLISLNYIAFNQNLTIWPMHLIAQRKVMPRQRRESNRWLCLSGAAVFGQLLGMAIIFLYDYRMRRKAHVIHDDNSQPYFISTTEEATEYEYVYSSCGDTLTYQYTVYNYHSFHGDEPNLDNHGYIEIDQST